jgi:hypothetical protein
MAKYGDDAKVAKHACHVQAQGAQFLPASFSILGAWGPAITARFDALWATEIQKAADNGNSIWPVVRRKLDWRGKVSVTLMRANAQMLLSRATRQGALCPAHAHRARVTHLPAHTSPALPLTLTNLSTDGALSQPIWDNLHFPPPRISQLHRDRWESLQVTVLHNLYSDREGKVPFTQEDNENTSTQRTTTTIFRTKK